MQDLNWTSFIFVIIGGALTILANYILHKLQRNAEKEKERQTVRAGLEAIYAELSVLWEIYHNDLGCRLEEVKDNEIFYWYYHPQQDYFSIYSNNSFVIANLLERDLQIKIIRAYVLAKSLLDYYYVYNLTLAQYENFTFNYERNKDQQNGEYKEDRRRELIRQVVELKKIHYIVKETIAMLLPKLREHIEKNNYQLQSHN